MLSTTPITHALSGIKPRHKISTHSLLRSVYKQNIEKIFQKLSTYEILTNIFNCDSVLAYRYTSTSMNSKNRRELVRLLASIKDSRLMGAFLDDLLTPAELDEIGTRWQIIKQLSLGVPQREIAAVLGVSITKITRGSRELRDTKGGFWKVLEKNNI